MAAGLSIGEIATRTGVPASTLRYYESLGILPEPGRAGGKRRYSDAAMEIVEAVKTAKALGFSLAEIQTLSRALRTGHFAVESWRELADHKIAELDRQIRDARAMKGYLEETLRCAAEADEECHCPAGPLSSLGS